MTRPISTDFAALIAAAQDTPVEQHDLVVTGAIGEGCLTATPAPRPDLWQLATASRWIYTTDPTVLADLRALLAKFGPSAGTPRGHIRVEGRPFTDLAGHPSVLVLRVVPTPFSDESGYLGDDALHALADYAPATRTEAMLVVAEDVARRAGHTTKLDLAAGTLSFETDLVVVRYVAGDEVILISARRAADEKILSQAQADSLESAECETTLMTQRFRAEV